MPLKIDERPSVPTETKYEYNGVEYNTKEEAQQAQEQRARAMYADAASVGFDENNFNLLMQSGTGLSQMSDSERSFINDRFMKTDYWTAQYKNNDVDKYLASVGLPPSSSLNKYRETYAKYSSSGNLQDNYGGVTEDQWKQITDLWKEDWQYTLTAEDAQRQALGLPPVAYDSMYTETQLDEELKAAGLPPSSLLTGKLIKKYNDKIDAYNSTGSVADVYGNLTDYDWQMLMSLWSKDWQYGLTNEDIARQRNGKPPVEYDSMYEDTLLDQQLKTLGLPPSKLLNGKLGSSYREWANEASQYNDFMYDVASRAMNKMQPSLDGAWISWSPQSALENAYNEALSDPRWSEFAKNHIGVKTELPDRYNEKYQVKDAYGSPAKDSDGQYIYDESKWQTDMDSALTKNAKVDSDEFAINLDVARKYFAGNAVSVRAQMLTDQKWETIQRGIPDDPFGFMKTGAEMWRQKYDPDKYTKAEIYDDYMTAFAFNDGKGFTYDILFPDVEITDDVRSIYDPYLDKVNNILYTEGAKAAEEYIGTHLNDDLRKAGIKAFEDSIFNQWLDAHPDATYDPEFRDAKINQYYSQLAERYEMSSEDIAALRNGDLTIEEHMGSIISNADDAYRYANRRAGHATGIKWDYGDERGVVYATSKESAGGMVRLLQDKLDATEPFDSGGYTNPEYSSIDKQLQKWQSAEKGWDALEYVYLSEAMTYTDEYKQLFGENGIDIESRMSSYYGIIGNQLDKDIINHNVSSTDVIKDEDKKYIIYLEETQGKGAAEEFVNNILIPSLDQRMSIERQNKYNQLYQNLPKAAKVAVGVANALVVYPTLAPLEAVGTIAQHIGTAFTRKDIYASKTFAVTDELLTAINSTMPDKSVGKFLYNLTPSLIQSAGHMALAAATYGLSTPYTLAVMGMEVYKSTVREALIEGKSPPQAVMLGICAGVAEIVSEKVSLDVFVKDVDVVRESVKAAIKSGVATDKKIVGNLCLNLLKHAAIQGGVEASEEVFSSLAQMMSEQLILGLDSEYSRNVQKYVESGMSQDEAERHAIWDKAKEVLLEGLGGLISGAVSVLGSDLIQVGTDVKIDKTGYRSFMAQSMYSLSAIGIDDAIKVARATAVTDSNGEYTLDSVKNAFTALNNQGASSHVLSAVRTQLFQTNNTEVNAFMDNAVNTAYARDLKALKNATENYVKKSTPKDETAANKFNVDALVDKYMGAVSEVVQKSDIKGLNDSLAAMRAGFVANVVETTERSSVNIGATTISNYVSRLSDTEQAEVKKIAETYVNQFKSAELDGAQVSNYANMGAALIYASRSGKYANDAQRVFGVDANVMTESINNALMNPDAKAAATFIDNVCRGIATFEAARQGGLLDVASGGTDSVTFVSGLMATTRTNAETSASRAVYEFINKYGSSESALSLLAVTGHFDSLNPIMQRFYTDALSMTKNSFVPMSDLSSTAENMSKAKVELDNKTSALETTQNAVNEMIESANARVAGLQAEVDALLDMTSVDENGNEVKTPSAENAEAYVKAQSVLNEAVSQQGKDVENGNKKVDSAQNDLNVAQEKYDKAKSAYDSMLNRFCASYIQALGAQLQAMENGDSIYPAELDRVTALAQNGTREDVNDVNRIIINAEKNAAIAFSAATNIAVEVCKFTDEFAKKYGIDKTRKAFVLNGKIYINENMIEPHVGYMQDILSHELGHIAELSADNYDNYAQFANKYLEARFGKDALESVKQNWKTEGLSEADANHELIAEFTRTHLLTDPTAIVTLCKKAPVMSVRIAQWLSTMKSNLFRAGLTNTGIAKNIDTAMRWYAKALKEATINAKNETVASSLDRARTAIAQAAEFEENLATPKASVAEAETTTTTETETTDAASTDEILTDAQIEEEVARIEETIDDEPAGIDATEEVAEESTEEPQTEIAETEQPAEAEPVQTDETTAELPFEIPENVERVINSVYNSNKNHAVDGRVNPNENKKMRNLIRNQLEKVAGQLGVTVDQAAIDAYSEQYMLPEIETGNSWVNDYKSTESKKTTSPFADYYNSTATNENAQYYHEAKLLENTFAEMSNRDRNLYGRPRAVVANDGVYVVREISANGAITNNIFAPGKRNIAVVESASRFVSGNNAVSHIGMDIESAKAIVVPSGHEYIGIRADARDSGVNVVMYDESEPHQFKNAQNRAANMRNVEYYPSKGSSLDNLLQKYGAIPEGMSPRVENRPVPRRTTATNKVSEMVRTAMEAPITTDEMATRMTDWLVDHGTGTFVPTSNKKTLATARGIVERAGSLSQAAQDLHADVSNGVGRNTDLLARAEVLFEAMQTDNTLTDIEREHIFSDLCIIASDSGRALQLSSELKRMTPQGHIDHMEQIGKRMAGRYEKRTKHRVTLELTQEQKDAYNAATSEDQRKAIDVEVSKEWGEKTGELTFGEKIRNWRYFAMLGNPRTHFRNMVGNALMLGVTRAKDTINTLYQLGFEDQYKTTTAVTKFADAETNAYIEEQFKKALPNMQGVSSKYLETMAKQAATGNTDETSKGFMAWLRKNSSGAESTRITNGRFAVGRALNRLSAFNSNMLELEDAKFLGYRFRSSMRQQIQAKGIDVNTITEAQQRQIVDYAMEEALRATFRDASAIADAINTLARTNRLANFALESIVPFRKTPINIAKRGIEYSPIGLMRSLYNVFGNKISYNNELKNIDSDTKLSVEERNAKKAAAKEMFMRDQVRAVDRLAAGTTGTILFAIGAFAAMSGLISIGRKDDDSAAFETALGKNTYSLNIGELSIDLSAFSPAAIPLLMGTALAGALGTERDDDQPLVSSIIATMCEAVDPITEMSMLSGIADVLLTDNSYSRYEEGANTRKITTLFGKGLESYVGQFVPTMVGQLERTIDPYARNYSAGDDYWASKAFGSEIGSAVKSLQNKVGLGWLSEPKVDLHGNPVRNYTNFGSGVLNFANNMILPATIKVDKKNEIDDELVRLYGVVDSADIFPSKPSRTIGSYKNSNGDNVNLKLDNDKEYMQYQQEVGQTTYDMLEELMASPSYVYASDDERAQMVESVIDTAKSVTKKRWKAQMIADREGK